MVIVQYGHGTGKGVYRRLGHREGAFVPALDKRLSRGEEVIPKTRKVVRKTVRISSILLFQWV